MLKRFSGFLAAHKVFIGHWAMEIAIVVLGILIAFALQGWAEGIEAKRRSDLAEARVRADLFDNAMLYVERIAVNDCARRRLKYLAEGLTRGGSDWRADTVSGAGVQSTVIAPVYRVPSRMAAVDSYRSASAANDLNGIAPLQRMYLDQLFDSAAQLNQTNRTELDLAAELKPLNAIALPNGGDRAAMLGRVARLDDANRLMVVMADQYLEAIKVAGFHATQEELRRVRMNTDWRKLATLARATYGGCWDANAIDRFDPRLK